MSAAGIPVTLNSDNMFLSDTDASAEVCHYVDDVGASWRLVGEALLASARASFHWRVNHSDAKGTTRLASTALSKEEWITRFTAAVDAALPPPCSQEGKPPPSPSVAFPAAASTEGEGGVEVPALSSRRILGSGLDGMKTSSLGPFHPF